MENPLSREQFKAVMMDMQIAEAIKKDVALQKDSTFTYSDADVYQAVFDHHNIKSETFEESFRYFTHFPKELEIIMQEVEDSLRKQEQSLNAEK